MSEQSNQKKTRRIQLQETLEAILGSSNVYFNPPESIKMKYPCIVYNLTDIDSTRADNLSYHTQRAYQLTCIGKDVDTDLPDRILETLEMCSYERSFKSDGLDHHVIRLYY